MRERDVNKLFVKACWGNGITPWPTGGRSKKGFADWTLFGPGRLHGYVEAKAHDGKVSKHQEDFLDRATASGVFAWVLWGERTREGTMRAIGQCIRLYLGQTPR